MLQEPVDGATRVLTIADTEFHVAPLGGRPSRDKLTIVKPTRAIDSYRELLAGFERPNIIEVGIAYGGSVGMLALIAQPERLVAIELSEERVDLLDRFVDDHDLAEVVRLHYGVDQSDRARLSAIVDTEFRDDELDLVIDDASHLHDQTVASFETLFPKVRPGGLYVIEDWNSDHAARALLAAAIADEDSPFHDWASATLDGRVRGAHDHQPGLSAVAANALADMPSGGSLHWPLSRLVTRLTLGPAEPSSGIASVEIDDFWVVVRRSETELTAGDFLLEEALPDHFGTLTM